MFSRKLDADCENTFAIRVRKNDRTRNLNLSSSVWMMMSRKFVLGSTLPTCSSTTSIYTRLTALALLDRDMGTADLLAGESFPTLAPSRSPAREAARGRSSP